MKAEVKCQVCGQTNWRNLPMAQEGRSVTTSGIIVDQPLGKAQCLNCGLVQRTHESFMGLGNFYEQDYKNYFDRPGAASYDLPRYRAMANWIYEVVKSFNPKNILDVGCGRGWTITELKKLLQNSQFTGVEPSIHNADKANEGGLKVYNGFVSTLKDKLEKYDLIYSTNVLQHVTNPENFISDLLEHLTDDGIILITCPNSTIPGSEMLFCDQNFSFAPIHLFKIAEKLNLHVLNWKDAPANELSLSEKQLIVLSKNKKNTSSLPDSIKNFDIVKNISERVNYLNNWKALDAIINNRLSNSGTIYNFGSSMWSYLLRAYCPKYWERVLSCTIEKVSGTFADKKVIPINEIKFKENDFLSLGVNPTYQMMLKEKLKPFCENIVTWNDVIEK